jgi:integrase
MACLRRRRRASGVWKIVLDWRDGRRRRRWREFPDTKAGQREAEIALGEVQKARRAGVSTDDKITVGAFIDEWLKFVKDTVSGQTYDYYKQQTERVKDRYQFDRLATLNAPKLLALGTELLAEGLARSTVAQVFSVTHCFLAHAVLRGDLTGNPASGLARAMKLRRKDTEDIKAMTEEQLAVFLKAADTLAPRDRLALHLYPQTGLRISEGLGLTVDGFDPEACKMRVVRQRLESGAIARLKTRASVRTVDLPAPLRDLIVEDLARRREDAMRRGQPPPEFIIGPISQETIRRAMALALERARITEHFTVHCLRHTFATLHLHRDPENLLWVSRQLGHASVKITADEYAQWIQPESPGTADAFAERIARKSVDLPIGRVLTYRSVGDAAVKNST